VDVVLNSLSEVKLQASLRCVKKHGRFLEIGKYDLSQNTQLGNERLQNDYFLINACNFFSNFDAIIIVVGKNYSDTKLGCGSLQAEYRDHRHALIHANCLEPCPFGKLKPRTTRDLVLLQLELHQKFTQKTRNIILIE